ncbi:MAG: T9SS type A sorting domain-containing protein [Candidatus Kryptoniota bacterium]
MHTVNFGIDVNIYDPNIGFSNVDSVFKMIAATGAKFVRAGVGWGAVEPQSGTFTWEPIDSLISMARSDGLQLLLEVGNTPSWDLPPGANTQNGQISFPPVDCDTAKGGGCPSFANYITNLVSHVAPLGVQYIILRNEPQNFPKNWKGGTAQQFVNFQHAGYMAAHAVDPNIKVLNGGTEILPDSLEVIKVKYANDTTLALHQKAFVDSLYSDSVYCRSFDVVDVHIGYHGPHWSPQIVDATEKMVEEHNGGKFVPVWVTECGYSSYPQVQVLPEIEDEMGGTSYTNGDTSQARFLIDVYKAIDADLNVMGLNWTFIIDPPFSGKYTQDGAGIGLCDEYYKPKISYYTLQNFLSTMTQVRRLETNIPGSFVLYQNYPNPFNPTTVINYQLPVTGRVGLNIYDVLGREVATLVDAKMKAGTYNVEWNASRYPSGVYFYQLTAGEFREVRKLILIK